MRILEGISYLSLDLWAGKIVELRAALLVSGAVRPVHP